MSFFGYMKGFEPESIHGMASAPHSRLVVSLLLPGSLDAEDWLLLVRKNRHMWPMQMTSHVMRLRTTCSRRNTCNGSAGG